MSYTVINFQSPYNISSLKDYMAGSSIDLASAWKLTPVDANGTALSSRAIGATTHTKDITLPGHGSTIFKMNGGMQVSSVDTEAGQGSAGLDLESVFTLDIVEEDVAKGIWNHAIFEVFTFCWSALKMGQYIDFSGRLRKIHSEGFKFTSEAVPLTQVYGARTLGRAFKYRCDVRRFADKFFENRCKIDPTGIAPDGKPYTVTGTVTTGGSNVQFTDSSRTEANKHFEYGVLKFTSGPLIDVEVEIKSYTAKTFYLQLPMVRVIDVGTTYAAVRGCDRTPQKCTFYNNIINYRGFPKIAGIDGLAHIIRAN